jgi:hypothetical protein
MSTRHEVLYYRRPVSLRVVNPVYLFWTSSASAPSELPHRSFTSLLEHPRRSALILHLFFSHIRQPVTSHPFLSHLEVTPVKKQPAPQINSEGSMHTVVPMMIVMTCTVSPKFSSPLGLGALFFCSRPRSIRSDAPPPDDHVRGRRQRASTLYVPLTWRAMKSRTFRVHLSCKCASPRS